MKLLQNKLVYLYKILNRMNNIKGRENKRFIDRVGEKYLTKEGYEIEIIEYFNKKNMTIKFNNGYKMYNVCFTNIKKALLSF